MPGADLAVLELRGLMGQRGPNWPIYDDMIAAEDII